MANTPNKVKYGLENVVYAKKTVSEAGEITYATPVKIPGAVNLSMDANGEPENFYADDGVYFVINNNNGYDGDLEIAMIPESFAMDILNQTKDNNGVLIENADAQLEEFALGFQFKGDRKHIRHWLYNCSASRPSVAGKTTEATKTPQTDTLKLSATPLPNGLVKCRSGSETTADVYNSWFGKVYMPDTTTEVQTE